MRGIAAVPRYAGRAMHILARKGIAAPALAAIAARPWKPADPHARADGPAHDIRAYRIDRANYLMTGHARIADARHMAFERDRVAMANATGVNPDAHLVRSGRRQVAFLRHELCARLGNDHRAHLGHR